MKLQDIFNKASEHLSAMDGPCTHSENDVSCAYRDGKGGMCAVGVFISDEHYTPEIENIGIADHNRGDLVRDVVARSVGLKALTREQLSLFAALQDAHDEWDCDVRYGVEDDTLSEVNHSEVMERNLENVRNRFDLECLS
jgi:hypothetical protein